jgi:hypothetical protein
MKRVSNMEMNQTLSTYQQNEKATNSIYNWFAYQYQKFCGVQVFPWF